jgi:hypothetical protein
MKKNTTKDQEQKTHRLRLNRETIRILGDPVLLGLARGGVVLSTVDSCDTATMGC